MLLSQVTSRICQHTCSSSINSQGRCGYHQRWRDWMMTVSTLRSFLLAISTPASREASRDGTTHLGSPRPFLQCHTIHLLSGRLSRRSDYCVWNWKVTKFQNLPRSNCVVIFQAVIKRLMTDVPFGVLLSGGLDSSLVAAVTVRHLAGTKAANRWGTKLHSFCVGLEVWTENDQQWS